MNESTGIIRVINSLSNKVTYRKFGETELEKYRKNLETKKGLLWNNGNLE